MAKISEFERETIAFIREKEAQERKEKAIMNAVEAARATEKSNYDVAIQMYKNLCKKEFVTPIPFERLAIHYQKNKDYDNVIQMCHLAIEKIKLDGRIGEKPLSRFEERLRKAMALKERTD